jgi:hypothetical protein
MPQQHFSEQPRPFSTYNSLTSPEEETDEAEQIARAAIEDYLDRVCAPLIETMPYADRLQLRREITGHLQSLRDAYEEMGESRDQATQNALAKFGEPEAVARLWRPTQATVRRPVRVKRWFQKQWPGMAATLAFCGLLGTLFISQPVSTEKTTSSTSSKAQIAQAPFSHREAVMQKNVQCTDCHSGANFQLPQTQNFEQVHRLVIPNQSPQKL